MSGRKDANLSASAFSIYDPYERFTTMQGAPKPDDTSSTAPPATVQPWQTFGLATGYQPRHGSPSHARYESTDSSIYDSSWFSSSSPSILSPASPENGYHSTGSASDFYGVWSPRNSVGHAGQMSRYPAIPQAPINTQGISSLRIASDAEEAPIQKEGEGGVIEGGGAEVDAEGDEEEMSGDESESEYVENRRNPLRKKGKRPAKASEVLAKEEEYESEFADMRNASTGRASKIRQSRLVSERKRRDALSSAFVEIRCLLPPDVQKLPKSRVLEEAADALKRARSEAEHYKKLWLNLKERQTWIDAAGNHVPAPYPSYPSGSAYAAQ